MSVADFEGPFCSCLGCSRGAAAFIDHPSRGRMAVCPDHVQDFEVIERV